VNRLSSINGVQSRSYAYDARGEITGDGIKSFTLNADGQITAITGVASYVYDGNGKRIKATPQSGSTEYALYSLAGDLVYTEKGTEQTDYLKLGGATLVELKKSGGATTATYLHPDLLGSPRKATNAAGAIRWQEHFDPYGAKLNGVAEKIGYTGHSHDPDSGYAYMQARFYDPLVGRFLSTDPIHFQDDNPFTFNRYAYANNNPYRFHDPDGRNPDRVFGIAFGLTHGPEENALQAQAEAAIGDFNAAEGIAAGEALRNGVDAYQSGAPLTGVVGKIVENGVRGKQRGGGRRAGANQSKSGSAASERAKNVAAGIPEKDLGPSGKPKIHVVDHGGKRGEAREAARRDVGKGGTTENHTGPIKGEDHYHGVTQDGRKSRVHHEYDR